MSPFKIEKFFVVYMCGNGKHLAPNSRKMVTKQFAMHNRPEESCTFNVDKLRREPFYSILNGVCLE